MNDAATKSQSRAFRSIPKRFEVFRSILKRFKMDETPPALVVAARCILLRIDATCCGAPIPLRISGIDEDLTTRLTTSRMITVRLSPPRLPGGIKHSTRFHSSSVRSLG